MLLILLFISLNIVTQGAFVAAVVEYHPELPVPRVYSRKEAESLMLRNLMGLKAQVGDASVDLVVFPEDALTGPDFASPEALRPFAQNISTGKWGAVMQQASRLATSLGTYLVLDLPELAPNGDLYNTAAAFDRSGFLVATHRKSHLYYEPQFTQAPPIATLFDTDFGERVGLCICFENMFAAPLDAIVHLNVTVLAQPQWWVNLTPLQTGAAMAAAVARRYGLPVLAASAGTSWYNSGSGIFDATGQALAQYYNPGLVGSSRFLAASVTARAAQPLQLSVESSRAAHPFSATVVEAAPKLKFTLRVASCIATGVFTADVQRGERFGLVYYSGPYNPMASGPVLFQLAPLCAFVRCSLPTANCISLYRGVQGTDGESQFSSLQVSAPIWSNLTFSWATNGNSTIVLPSEFRSVNASGYITIRGPTTVSSVTLWSVC